MQGEAHAPRLGRSHLPTIANKPCPFMPTKRRPIDVQDLDKMLDETMETRHHPSPSVSPPFSGDDMANIPRRQSSVDDSLRSSSPIDEETIS